MNISVASGKGGTGKTMVATSLALAILNDQPVQLLDCDVEEPNAHLFIRQDAIKSTNVSLPIPQVDYDKCQYCGKCAEVCRFKAIAFLKKTLVIFPDVCHSCSACWHFCPSGALVPAPRKVGTVNIGRSGELKLITGRLNLGIHASPPVIKAVRNTAEKEIITIIDGPPGSSCPVMAAVEGTDYCLLVTEPTPFGLNDLSLAVDMLNVLKVPYGVIINRDVPGSEIIDRYCQEKGIRILLRIPLQMEIARSYSRGITLVEHDSAWTERFAELFRQVRREVAK
ncbi:hypothetical protein N752_09265 [Desulforamulus aquiferis]|nr:ATP-binding protein [Desulforamulus aquiferis]RYD05525.1 hypothetical protein N752_09265 [Desulforamulus aquiferis]